MMCSAGEMKEEVRVILNRAFQEKAEAIVKEPLIELNRIIRERLKQRKETKLKRQEAEFDSKISPAVN